MLSVIKTEEGKKWRNWAETWESKPEKILYPASIEEVVSIVKEASKLKKKIRVVGASHSFTGLVATDVWLVSLDLLSGIKTLMRKRVRLPSLVVQDYFKSEKPLGRQAMPKKI